MSFETNPTVGIRAAEPADLPAVEGIVRTTMAWE